MNQQIRGSGWIACQQSHSMLPTHSRYLISLVTCIFLAMTSSFLPCIFALWHLTPSEGGYFVQQIQKRTAFFILLLPLHVLIQLVLCGTPQVDRHCNRRRACMHACRLSCCPGGAASPRITRGLQCAAPLWRHQPPATAMKRHLTLKCEQPPRSVYIPSTPCINMTCGCLYCCNLQSNIRQLQLVGF